MARQRKSPRAMSWRFTAFDKQAIKNAAEAMRRIYVRGEYYDPIRGAWFKGSPGPEIVPTSRGLVEVGFERYSAGDALPEGDYAVVTHHSSLRIPMDDLTSFPKRYRPPPRRRST